MIDRTRYWQDGYANVSGLLPQAVMAQVLSDVSDVFEAQLRRLRLPTERENGLISERCLLRLFHEDPEVFFASGKAVQHLPCVVGLQLDDRIHAALAHIGIEKPLISGRPILSLVAADIERWGGYSIRRLHQDWHAMQGSRDGTVVWLPLQPIDETGFPLEVVPASHLSGALAWEPDPAGSRLTRDADIGPAIALINGPGDAVVFSAFLVHGTGSGEEGRARLAISFRFNSLAEPSFVERGYPDPILHRPQREPLHAGFPSPDSLRAFFQSRAEHKT